MPIETVVNPRPRITRHDLPMAMGTTPDVFHGQFTPDSVGLWTYRVDAWGDPIATWRKAVVAKLDAGQGEDELSNDLLVGARLLERATTGVPRKLRDPIIEAAELLRKPGDPFTRAGAALSPEVTQLLTEYPLRELVTRGEQYGVWVDRPLARFSGMVRDVSALDRRVGQERQARPRHVRDRHQSASAHRRDGLRCGLPSADSSDRQGSSQRPATTRSPLRPATSVHRGRSAATRAATTRSIPSWARSRTSTTSSPPHAITVWKWHWIWPCSAHPTIRGRRTHPEWFTVLPDGTIAYAENPPKKYQDIYPINFDDDPAGLYEEVLRVVRFWVSHGIKVFRVDNPHTKPPDFWAWLIGKVKSEDPDVLFLAEAFTRPARLYGLAKLGFTQSYTYFTWRTAKWELTEFGQQIAEHADYARPNLFVNTPDILHESLQHGGPGMFAIRAVLAATMSSAVGRVFGLRALRAPSRPRGQ